MTARILLLFVKIAMKLDTSVYINRNDILNIPINQLHSSSKWFKYWQSHNQHLQPASKRQNSFASPLQILWYLTGAKNITQDQHTQNISSLIFTIARNMVPQKCSDVWNIRTCLLYANFWWNISMMNCTLFPKQPHSSNMPQKRIQKDLSL